MAFIARSLDLHGIIQMCYVWRLAHHWRKLLKIEPFNKFRFYGVFSPSCLYIFDDNHVYSLKTTFYLDAGRREVAKEAADIWLQFDE